MGATHLSPYNVLKPINSSLYTNQGIKCLKTAEKHVKSKINKVRREMKALDYPLISQSPLDLYLMYGKRLHVWRRRVGITTTSMELLLFVYRELLINGGAVSSYYIAKVLTGLPDPSNEALNIRTKLDLMVRKGLMVLLGQNDKQAYLYIPSVKAIEDIENIFK